MDIQDQANPLSDRSLPHNTAWAVAGNVCFAGGRFLIFVLLWKFLPSEQVGQAILALAIVTPLSFFLNMGLRLVIVTDTANRSVWDSIRHVGRRKAGYPSPGRRRARGRELGGYIFGRTAKARTHEICVGLSDP